MARAPSTSSRQQQQRKSKAKARSNMPPQEQTVAVTPAAAAVQLTSVESPQRKQAAAKKKLGSSAKLAVKAQQQQSASASTMRRACPVQTLPPEMAAMLFPFLTWKDTSAMALVSASWHRLTMENKRAHYEWKNTVIIGQTANESFEMLLRNERGCLNARFAPNLVIVSVGSGASAAFKTGSYWKSLAQTLESGKLVPLGCPVVTLYTPMGVLGTGGEGDPTAAREYEEELGEYGDSPSKTMTLSITVAHLPDTSIETAAFDRKWLRQQARGRGEDAEYPFTSTIDGGSSEYGTEAHSATDDPPSFLLFSVNANSSEELAPIVTRWHPGAPVAGGIFPFADRCIPMALFRRNSTQEQEQSRKHQLARKAKQTPASAGTLEFPTNLLVRVHGKVGMRVFASCGFHPITPVVKCETVSSAYLLDQFAHYRAYETVLWRNPVTGEEVQYRLIDLLRQYGSFTRENSLNIYTSASLAPMQAIVEASKECIESELIATAPLAGTIDRLDMLICTADGDVLSMDKHWEVGRFGFVAVQIPECGKFAHRIALTALKTRMAERRETPLGAFMVECALKGQELYGETDVETKIYAQIFPGLPLSGCFSGGEVGPVAYPMGLSSCMVANGPQLQANTTTGAIFYVKNPRAPSA
ncbi:hypothetical protein Gpo141_00008382 [Globisporangium polare]